MISRVLRGAAAVACLAGGLLIDAQLVGTASTAGAQASSCASSAELLIAHQDGSVNLESPITATCPLAPYYGSLATTHLAAPIVGIATTPYGGGYWLVGADGGVFTFGNANYYGSLGHVHLNAPIVGITPTADGGGYWLVAADGGVFSFGDASFYGSMGGIKLNAPIVSIASDPATGGYLLAASDGGVFAFNATFFGSMSGTTLAAPIRFIEGTADAKGYRLVGGDGGVFNFGDAQFYGAGTNLGVYGWGAMTPTPDDAGYWLATNFAPKGALNVASFGDAAPYDEHLAAGTLTKSPVIAAATYLPYSGTALPNPPTTTTTTTPSNPGTVPTSFPSCVNVAGVPTIVQSPTSEDVPVGGTASFTALASSTPAATVQWQVSVNEGATYTNIANAVNTTLTFAVTPTESGGFYRAVFGNTDGYAPTASAILTVGDAPDVVTEPTTQEVTAGNTATFNAAATGTPTPTTQWEVSTDGGTTWTPIAGANADSYSFVVAQSQDHSEYQAIFDNSAGSAQTSVAELYEEAIPTC
jgi:Immunoglobulin I-set domain